MSNILQIGFTTEGSTDVRFLKNIIWKIFQEIATECNGVIDVYEPEFLKKGDGSFVEKVLGVCEMFNYFHVICIHCDSDSASTENVFNYSINPAFDAVDKSENNLCKNLVPVIPVQMSEAWMLCNVDLLMEKIGTKLSAADLGLPTKPSQIEKIANPKEIINEAIRKAKNQSTRRRRKELSISQLYSPISQELKIEDLMTLDSFVAFRDHVRSAFKKLNYLSD